ncbi:MAG: S1 family peptidase [Bacteroidota bacterium]
MQLLLLAFIIGQFSITSNAYTMKNHSEHNDSLSKEISKYSYKCHALYPELKAGDNVDMGTCFFVSKGEDAFFITALHVASGVNTVSKKARTLFDFLVIKNNKNDILIDVKGVRNEILNIDLPPGMALYDVFIKKIDKTILQRHNINSIQYDDFLMTEVPDKKWQIYSVGYPTTIKRINADYAIPSFQSGIITDVGRNSDNLFSSSMSVEPGMSGGPVFTILNEKIKLIGVISAGKVDTSRISKIIFTGRQIQSRRYW